MIIIGNRNFGFTLIELLVGVSISVMLMISVSIFVTSGMKNILDINKVLENSGNFNDFSSNLQNTFNYTGSGKYINIISSTGVLFKRDQYFDKGGFSYIGETNISEFYCMSGSESKITKHAIIKTFVPFEEQGENMFGSAAGSYDKIFTAKAGNYTSYALDHVVKNSAGDIMIGKGIYGGPLPNPPLTGEGIYGTGIYLNNPTGLAMSGSDILFISDTLNDRVLYYNIATKKIYKLLDEFDGLSEPTGLYYNAGKLYISNSGKGEILEYSSPIILSNPTLTMSGFSQNINKIDITFSGSNAPNLTNLGFFNITGNSTSPNYLTGTSDNLKYYFVTKQAESIQTTCLGTEIQFTNGKPSIYCTKSGSGKTANYPTSTISKIEVNNLNLFTSNGTYYVDLKLFNGTSLKYQKYFPYFTQGDGDILTPGDNTLKVFKSGLKYPTGLWWSGGNLKYNEFYKNPSRFNFQNTFYNENSDYILKTPLKSLLVDKTGNLFTLFMKYYKNYNCYNLDDNSQRSYVLKKKF